MNDVGQSEQMKQTKYGLIIDGQTLQYALEYPLALEFLLLAQSCQVVVCCRAAPVQKVSTRWLSLLSTRGLGAIYRRRRNAFSKFYFKVKL